MASGVAIAMTQQGNSRRVQKLCPRLNRTCSAADERRKHSAAEHTPLFAT
jgi:hypothetical protein